MKMAYETPEISRKDDQKLQLLLTSRIFVFASVC